jgi:GTP-binding protein Era
MSGQKNGARHRSGFVSILGRPNAGKSTLLNALVATKVAIVSAKPQTTRTSVQAVLTQPGAQVVFLDTPGVHESKILLHKRMMDSVREALLERDLLIWVVDASAGIDETDLRAAAIVKGRNAPLFVVLNKVDRVDNKNLLLSMTERYRTELDPAEVIPVSALAGDGVDDLVRTIIEVLPAGPKYFPDDHLTDQPERFLASEMIREKVLELTRQEVPHAVAVLVEQWEESPRLVKIAATIFVEREGQKRIVIGTGGAVLKKIGTMAREDIEALLRKKVFLELFVKVRTDWRESAGFLDEIDWRRMMGGDPE